MSQQQSNESIAIEREREQITYKCTDRHRH